MKKKKGAGFLMSFLAIMFPWLVMLIYDNPAGFFITLVLQSSVIGWVPASMWAWKIIHEKNEEDKVSLDINDTNP